MCCMYNMSLLMSLARSQLLNCRCVIMCHTMIGMGIQRVHTQNAPMPSTCALVHSRCRVQLHHSASTGNWALHQVVASSAVARSHVQRSTQAVAGSGQLDLALAWRLLCASVPCNGPRQLPPSMPSAAWPRRRGLRPAAVPQHRCQSAHWHLDGLDPTRGEFWSGCNCSRGHTAHS